MIKQKQKGSYQPFLTACGRSKESLSILAATQENPFVPLIDIINKKMKSWTHPLSPYPWIPGTSHPSHLTTLPPFPTFHLTTLPAFPPCHLTTLPPTNKSFQNSNIKPYVSPHIVFNRRFTISEFRCYLIRCYFKWKYNY